MTEREKALEALDGIAGAAMAAPWISVEQVNSYKDTIRAALTAQQEPNPWRAVADGLAKIVETAMEERDRTWPDAREALAAFAAAKKL